MVLKKIAVSSWRITALATAIALLTTAVGLFAAQRSIDRVDQMRPQIAQLISDSLGAQVALGELSADWYGPIPRLKLDSLSLYTESGHVPLELSVVRLEVNLWRSLWHRTFIWRELSAERVVVVLEEQQAGRWSMQGMPTREGGLRLNTLLAPLAYSRFVQLLDLEIELQPLRGSSTRLHGTQLRVENQGEFHRLQASLSFDHTQSVPIKVVAEGHGDPLDREAFTGKGYIELDQLDLASPLATLGSALFPALFVDMQQLTELSVPLAGDVWFELSQGGVLDFHGQLEAKQIPLNWASDLDPITDLTTQLSGWLTPEIDWGVRLQQIDLNWAQRAVKPFNMAFSQSLTEPVEFALAFNQINADLLVELLADSGLLLPKWQTLVEDVNPRGDLQRVTVGRTEEGYFVAADLRDFSLDPWRGVPGIIGLDGQLELQGERAALQLRDSDGLELLLYPNYSDYIVANSAEGIVTAEWSSASGELQVAGHQLAAQALNGTSAISFYSYRSSPTSRANSFYELSIAAQRLQGPTWATYLPEKLPPALLNWLPNALQDPQIEQFKLLVRGDRDSRETLSLSSQVAVNLDDGMLSYSPDWPTLEQLKGSILVSDGRVGAHFDRLTSGPVILRNIAVGRAAGSNELALAAQSSGPLKGYRDFLSSTTLAEPLKVLLGWDYRGSADADVALTIPLAARSNAELAQNIDYRVAMELFEGAILLNKPALVIDQIDGELVVSRQEGVVGSGLTGRVVDKPVEFSLYSNIGGQRVSFTAPFNSQLLNQLSPLRWEQLITGESSLSGLLTLPPASAKLPVRLTVQSDQVGLNYRMPAPLEKSAGEAEPLQVDVIFKRDEQRVTVNSSRLTAQLALSENTLLRGVVNIAASEPLPEQGQFLIATKQPQLDWRMWRDWWLDLPSGTWGAALQRESSPALQVGFDLQVATLPDTGFIGEQINMSGNLSSSGVDFAVDAKHYAGIGFWPYQHSADQPISLALAELRVPSLQADEDFLLNPQSLASLPAVDFSVQSLTWGERQLGSLIFELRPELDRLRFEKIGGELLGVHLGGEREKFGLESNGLIWDYATATPTTSLAGGFATGDIGELFGLLGSERIADSSAAYVQADISWPGHPWQLNSEQLSGELQVELNDGQFYSRRGGGETALRAISLFNFANWLRRLQFDFSDVFGENLAYDQLAGTLLFDNELLTLSPPLTAKLPSGNMALSAELDLAAQTIDGKLVATLPVATNLPWIVALVGGLPAAAGVYLTSKIMSQEIDRLSSISYLLSGPWDDIELEVDRVFARQLEQ